MMRSSYLTANQAHSDVQVKLGQSDVQVEQDLSDTRINQSQSDIRNTTSIVTPECLDETTTSRAVMQLR